MITIVTLKKKWVNPDSGKEFKKGSSIALHPRAAAQLVCDGYGESEQVESEVKNDKGEE